MTAWAAVLAPLQQVLSRLESMPRPLWPGEPGAQVHADPPSPPPPSSRRVCVDS